MANGWFKVDRDLVDQLPPVHLQVLTVLVRRARYNGNQIDPRTGAEMQRGQLCYGLEELSEKVDRPIKRVRIALQDLEKWGILTARRGHARGTTIFIGQMRWVEDDRGQTPDKQTATKVEQEVKEEIKQRKKKASGLQPSAASIEVLKKFNEVTGRQFRNSPGLAFIDVLLSSGSSQEELIGVARIAARDIRRQAQMPGKEYVLRFIDPKTIYGAANYPGYLATYLDAVEDDKKAAEMFGV